MSYLACLESSVVGQLLRWLLLSLSIQGGDGADRPKEDLGSHRDIERSVGRQFVIAG